MRNWLRPALGGVAFAMLLVGSWLALSWAPPDREMGDVQRIMYVHVPSVWMATFLSSIRCGGCVR